MTVFSQIVTQLICDSHSGDRHICDGAAFPDFSLSTISEYLNHGWLTGRPFGCWMKHYRAHMRQMKLQARTSPYHMNIAVILTAHMA